MTFYVGPDGRRCHPGAGPNPHRRRLPPALAAAIDAMAPAEAERFLASHDYYPVHDAGAERHLLLITEYDDGDDDG